MNIIAGVLVLIVSVAIGMYLDFCVDVKFRGVYWLLGCVAGTIAGAFLAC